MNYGPKSRRRPIDRRPRGPPALGLGFIGAPVLAAAAPFIISEGNALERQVPQWHIAWAGKKTGTGRIASLLAALVGRSIFSINKERPMEGLGLGWFGFLIVGLLAGWIAEKVMKRDQGLLTNLVVGVVGAYLGAFIFRLLGISTAGSFIWALIVSVVGAVLLLAIVGAVRRRS